MLEITAFSFQYSANGYSAKQFRKQRAEAKPYEGIFKKSRILHGLDATEASDDASNDSDTNEPTVINFNQVLNDAELLEACGGRTAHKLVFLPPPPFPPHSLTLFTYIVG